MKVRLREGESECWQVTLPCVIMMCFEGAAMTWRDIKELALVCVWRCVCVKETSGVMGECSKGRWMKIKKVEMRKDREKEREREGREREIEM